MHVPLTAAGTPMVAPFPPLADRFRHVFWSGDLNYRVNTTRKMADKLLTSEMLEVMMANDQLNAERAAGRVFGGYHEEPLAFPPTYKFDVDTDTYDSSAKARCVPAGRVSRNLAS